MGFASVQIPAWTVLSLSPTSGLTATTLASLDGVGDYSNFTGRCLKTEQEAPPKPTVVTKCRPGRAWKWS